MSTCCMNTICPVCGFAVRADMPPLNFRPELDGSHSVNDEGTFRVCSAPCALQAQATPPRYHAAACVNQKSAPAINDSVADHPEGA